MRRLFRYENKKDPLASPRVFYNRMVRNGLWAVITVILSLAIGCWGYMYFDRLDFLDAFTNAAMLLSGMGPVAPLTSPGAKIFASLYAIASGLLLFAVAGLMMAPVYHRILHRFHVDEQDPTQDQ